MDVYSLEPLKRVEFSVIMDNGLCAGMITADFSPFTKTRLRIRNISLNSSYMSQTVIRQALAELISSGQELGAQTFSWHYPEPEGTDYTDEANDPYVALMRSVAVFYPEYDLVRTVHGRDYKINLEILPAGMRHDDHFSAEWASDSGLKFIPLEEMGPFVREIAAIMAEDRDAKLLTPLGVKYYDPDTSFIALCRGEVMGWLVSSKVDDLTVYFRSYYTAKKFRAYRGGGGVIIATAMRRVQKKYSVINVFIDDRSRASKRFYPHYFGRAFSESTRYFYLDLVPKRQAVML